MVLHHHHPRSAPIKLVLCSHMTLDIILMMPKFRFRAWTPPKHGGQAVAPAAVTLPQQGFWVGWGAGHLTDQSDEEI